MENIRDYFYNIYKTTSSILKGMILTFKTAMEPKATYGYPDVKPTMPERTRGRLHNVVEDCIGCKACEIACPVDCISMDLITRGKDEPRPLTSTESGGVARKFKVPRFDIDLSLCCWCGLCTVVCPTKCLTMTKEFEFSVFDRSDWVYHFGESQLGYDYEKAYWEEHSEELETWKKEQEAKKVKAEQRVAAAKAPGEGPAEKNKTE